MDIQKAIEWQKAFKKTYKGMLKEVDKACDMAIETLEKQRAKKPIEEKRVYASGQSDYVCPSCGDSVMMLDPECQAYKLEYCASCGQHLNWGNDDEWQLLGTPDSE